MEECIILQLRVYHSVRVYEKRKMMFLNFEELDMYFSVALEPRPKLQFFPKHVLKKKIAHKSFLRTLQNVLKNVHSHEQMRTKWNILFRIQTLLWKRLGMYFTQGSLFRKFMILQSFVSDLLRCCLCYKSCIMRDFVV